MTPDQLGESLERHRWWLQGRTEGRRANLTFANLEGADLSRRDLRGAQLTGARLRGARLNGSNLAGADLFIADLAQADVRGADLSGCALRGAQRLTTLGCAVYEGSGYPHDAIELFRRMVRWIVVENFDRETVERGAGFLHQA